MEFGLTAAGRIEDASTARVFRWLLERQTDTRGNVIEYVYRSFPGGQNLNQKLSGPRPLRAWFAALDSISLCRL
jgi:hypothetical protein